MGRLAIQSITFILLFFVLSGDATAQIYRKMEYNRKGNQKSVWNFAFATYLILNGETDYVWNHALKLYGEDSLREEENRFEISHTDENLGLFDIRSISFPDDTTLTVFGTFYIVDYDLSEAEQYKMFISRVTQDGVNQMMKVQTGADGRKFVKRWYNNDYIQIHDTDLISVRVVNRSKWFHTEKELRRFYIRYLVAAGATRVALISATVGGAILVLKNGKWGT